ncbi:MAG: sulfite exporter TauE/SafE family protein [Deltaproteobacteria bacterium]|nr:sulfite exporter TauE/SafE family protein [Deltaproteobacteria bacterium]
MIEYLLIFAAGVLGSIHCMGMCGGFPIAISTVPKKCRIRKVSSHLLYNIGRVFTYTFLGMLVGYLGLRIEKIGAFISGQVILSTLAGIFMIYLGLQIAGLIGEKNIPGFTPFYNLLKKIMATFLKHGKMSGSFYLGIFNGFLPCPLVYGFLLAATASGSPIKGALVMLSLGLGTIPTMFFLGGLGEVITPNFKARLSRIPGFLVLIFGVITLARGILPYISELGHRGPFFH